MPITTANFRICVSYSWIDSFYGPCQGSNLFTSLREAAINIRDSRKLPASVVSFSVFRPHQTIPCIQGDLK